MASEAVKIYDTNSRKPALMVIGAGFLWGIIGVFSNTLSSLGFTPIQITEGRCAVSAVCLLIFLLIKNKNELKINIKDSFFCFKYCSFRLYKHNASIFALYIRT